MTKPVFRVSEHGTKSWWLNGLYHREDGPAITFIDGTREWWLNGKRHREDGPAVITSYNNKEWWLNGKFIHRGWDEPENWDDLVKLAQVKWIMDE
jgi:hypothetical protein